VFPYPDLSEAKSLTITIELTPVQEAVLQAQAAAAGVDAAEYARQLLALDLTALPLPKTGAEAIEYWQQAGVFGLFGNRGNAQEFARQLRGGTKQCNSDNASEADAAEPPSQPYPRRRCYSPPMF
jgi:hypothetical protein